VTREAKRFWLAAAAVAGGWTVLASLLFPYEALGFGTGPERLRVWLLLLWTSGIMAICFGAAGVLSYGGSIGVREVADAGSLTGALSARRRAKRETGSLYTNFAWWLIVTGALLICIYFVAWGISYG